MACTCSDPAKRAAREAKRARTASRPPRSPGAATPSRTEEGESECLTSLTRGPAAPSQSEKDSPTVTATRDGGPKPPAPLVVPSGTVAEVLAWVGDDPLRAVAARIVEERGKGRKSLLDAL